MRRLLPVALSSLAALLLALAFTQSSGDSQSGKVARTSLGAVYTQAAPLKASPAASSFSARLAAAVAFAKGRRGQVAFAIVDSQGRVQGLRLSVGFRSASLIKAMLLVAYLREGLPLGASERQRLQQMADHSSNAAASAVYASVGDSGLKELAAAAGMRDFTTLGYWGDNNLSARDQARFFWLLPRLLPQRERAFALRLLATAQPDERWGIPAAAQSYRVYFKGGWRPLEYTAAGDYLRSGPWLLHQAAYLVKGHEHLAIAVLTESPSSLYGRQTVRGVADALLASGKSR